MNPEIKLRKLSMSYFRGVTDELSLDFTGDYRSVAIFGLNGEGKSTINQALEWFYKDRVSVLSGEGSDGIDITDIINLNAKEGCKTLVDVVFNKSPLNSSKELDGRRGKFSNRSGDFNSYITEQVAYDRLYLDHRTILWLILKRKGEKKDELAKIVGYEDIVRVRDAVASTLRDLERNSNLSQLRSRIQDNNGLMIKEIFGKIVEDMPDLCAAAQNFLKEFGIEDRPSTITDLESAIRKAIQYLPSEEKAKERVGLERLKEQVRLFREKSNPLPAIESWLNKASALIKDKDAISKLNYDLLLRQAEKILNEETERETCPVCEQVVDRDHILKEIIDKYRKLEEIKARKNELETALTTLKRTIDDLRRDSAAILNNSSQLKINVPVDGIQSYEKSFDLFQQVLIDVMSNMEIKAHDTEQQKKILTNCHKGLDLIDQEIEERIGGLAVTEEERKRQTAYQKLVRGKDVVLENMRLQKEVAVLEEQIAAVRRVSDELLQMQNKALQDVIEILSEDIDKYFTFLNKKENIKNVRLEIKGDEGIEFTLNFYGYDASPPKKYLSESQMNSLGIALFLAAVKNFNKANKFFVLDDVLLSFDRNYRRRLLDLLEVEFTDYQIILLTHEEYWFQMMKRKFPQWLSKEVMWTFEHGIQFKDDQGNWLENVRMKLKKGDKIGNDLRSGLESLLKSICETLEVKLPFKRDMENEKRTLGDLFPNLTSTLKEHKSDVIDSSDYKDLAVSNFVTTCSSHDNPDVDSIGDLQETIEHIDRFQKLFICPKGRFIERKNVIPGNGKISCRCGCQQLTWR